MRTETHEFETVIIRLAIDENEIGFDMAVTVIAPFSGQRMIEIPARQRSICGEQVDDLRQESVELLAVPPGFLAHVVMLEAGGVFNLPHSDCAAVCPASPL